MRARLSPGLEAQLLEAGRRARPLEACGLWIGTEGSAGWTVREAFESVNLAHPGRDRFRVDPLVQLRVERRAAALGARVLGSWHSHPGGTARPSRLDLAGARPGELLGIVALAGGGAARLHLWTRFGERALEVSRDPARDPRELLPHLGFRSLGPLDEG